MKVALRQVGPPRPSFADCPRVQEQNMPETLGRTRQIAWLGCAFLVWLIAIAAARANGPVGDFVGLTPKKSAVPTISSQSSGVVPPAAQASAASPATDDKYIGEAACIDCHDKQRSGYFDSPHHRAS